MNTATKTAIISAANDYIKEKQMTPNALSKQCKINMTYLHYMLKGDTKIQETEIADKWYLKLASFIGYKVDNRVIGTEPTSEFLKLISKLTKAKDHQEHFMFIAPTGRGKSFAIDKFKKQNPTHTYVVTVNSLMKVTDVIQELADTLGVNVWGTLHRRQHTIVQKLRELKMKGGKPLVIFDEGENMKLATLQALKGIYDGIKMHCGIGLIGTKQLLDQLTRLKDRDKQGAPQIYRRFKANTCVMVGSKLGLDKHFVDKYVTDAELKRLLHDLCENYGEFVDYMEPVLREANEKGVPVTEEFFRLIHDMPKVAV